MANELQRSENDKQLQDLTPIAIKKLQEVMLTSVDDAAVLRAAENVLDRTGYARQSKVEQRILVSLDPDSIKRLEQVARIIDGEVLAEGSNLALPDTNKR